MVAIARLGSVSLDAAEPGGLARFYAELLGAEVAFENEDFCAAKLGPQLWLSTQRVAGFRAPHWRDGDVPQQMHLDLAVEDLDEAEAAAIGLGARRPESQPNPSRWRVLLDPAGHPVCLATLIPE